MLTFHASSVSSSATQPCAVTYPHTPNPNATDEYQ